MNILFNLAIKNIRSTGLRTWLNVLTLSVGFVFVIWMQGLMNGLIQQMESAQIDNEYAGGQYWHKEYDPLDPLTIQDAHSQPDTALQNLVETGHVTPILLAVGSLYPDGRGQSVLLRGINPTQQIISIPSHVLKNENDDQIPALIGTRMAKHTNLKMGDTVTLRWRDTHGIFDAIDITIAHIMNMPVPGLDTGQVWLSLESLRKMTNLPNSATLFIAKKDTESFVNDPSFQLKSQKFLLKDIQALFETKKTPRYILYAFLMGMGLLAIFDTQVLAIFRRRKEIGTLMALGMNRLQVVWLFTIEGSLNGILAMLLGAVWGIPLIVYTAVIGLPILKLTDSYGFAIGSRLYASYAPGVLIITLLILLLSVVIVSFLPSNKISHMKTTDALRGKA